MSEKGSRALVEENSKLESVNRALPWYRQVNREQWKAFLATFAGWVLDGFDATIITFVLIDIQQSFAVDKALAGALGTVTLFFRLIGGVAAGDGENQAEQWWRESHCYKLVAEQRGQMNRPPL